MATNIKEDCSIMYIILIEVDQYVRLTEYILNSIKCEHNVLHCT